MHISEIHLRDPFIVPYEGVYYLYGTPGQFAWTDHAYYLEAYSSRDLENWEGPFTVFTPDADFWADRHFWAPEVHCYKGRFYMLCSFKSPTRCRATQILAADAPLGPFRPLTDRPATPWDWECLDGTLFDDGERPWLVFSHEWLQCGDGEIWAQPLTEDLTRAEGEPVLLFRASEAPWTVPVQDSPVGGKSGPCYVTDGPYLRRLPGGALGMIWSSFGKEGYALGQAISHHGVAGPWEQAEQPLFSKDGGHGMLFDTIEGETRLVIHQPNQNPLERPVLFPVEVGAEGFTL